MPTKKEHLLKERQFLWDVVSQRNRNMWTMGAFFVPISFLILAYAVATNKTLLPSNSGILALSSIVAYFSWLLLYKRCNDINGLFIQEIKRIELILRDKNLRSIGKIDNKRIFWLSHEFPEYVYIALWILLIVLWVIFCF